MSDSNNALLRFDLSGLTAPTSAMLRLYTTDQYGTADIGVFHAAPGRQGPPPDLEAGLASAFQDDNGVVSHADVLLFEDYESDTWTDNWSDLGGEYDIADGDPAFGFDALAGRALRVLLPGGSNTALNTGFNFMEEIGSEPEEIYFRYYIRFGSDWVQTVDGGKLPGISGTYGVAGWGGRPSDGTNGWSARGSFKLTVPTGNNPLGGMQPIGNYVYHADMDGSYGDIYLWTENWGVEGYGGVLQNDAWYCLEQYVRMNTPGQNDGVLRAWVNGRKSLEKVDMRFRDVTDLKIERVWMNIYHGGTAASPYDQHVFIDNVVIARSYIGPMTGAPPPPPLDGGVATGDSGTASDGGVNPGVDGGVPAGGSFAGEDDSSGCACGMEPKKRIRTTIASLVAAWWRSQAD